MPKWNVRSLQLRLALRLGLLFLAATALAVGALVYETHRTAVALGEQNLLDRAHELASSIERGANGAATLELAPRLSALYDSPASVNAYAIFDARGHVIGASDPELSAYAAAKAPGSREPQFFRLDSFGYDGGDYYGLGVELDSAAGPLFVTVAEDGDVDDLFHAMLEEFVVDVAWIIPVFIAATLLVGVLAIRGGLRPLRAVCEQAAMIEPGAISMRLPERNLPSEVLPLVAAVNRALDRLERGFEVQRRFTADAAHELRTPLTIITGALESLDGDGELAKLRQDVARMNRLVGQLLRVARLDSLALDLSEDVDLCEIAREAVEQLAPLAIAQDRSLALAATGPTVVKGNRHAIADALRNLVENAINHTRPRTEVVVGAGSGRLWVADRGPGVRAEDRERVFERFWRDSGARGEGAGLGLAIVQETMKAHGGKVEISAEPGGGARFTLVFRA
jgi:signal transduction histidine kinase